MVNKFGKVSKLDLTASFKDGRTILSDVSFTAPFKVMRPLYLKDTSPFAQKGEACMTVMILAASAGIMAGDRQAFTIHVHEGAEMALISQAYEKVHRMEESWAERETQIAVEEDAALYYTPLPVIPFAGSDFRSRMRVDLSGETARFVYREILTCGRVAHGERFSYRRFQNEVSVYQAGKIVYRDNTCYEPERMDMEGFGMYEGFTHLGNLLLFNMPKSEEWIGRARALIDEAPDTEGGVTRLACESIVVRVLGKNADKLTTLLEDLLVLP